MLEATVAEVKARVDQNRDQKFSCSERQKGTDSRHKTEEEPSDLRRERGLENTKSAYLGERKDNGVINCDSK